MLHFNRKTEYALLAIEHMVRKENQPRRGVEGEAPSSASGGRGGLSASGGGRPAKGGRSASPYGLITSVREIAGVHRIPYPLLAKVLQRLAGKGFVKAVHGTKGGYVLAKRPVDITVADIVKTFDGPFAMAECFREEKITCPQWDGCLIKNPFYELNLKIHRLLTETTIADLIGNKGENFSLKDLI